MPTRQWRKLFAGYYQQFTTEVDQLLLNSSYKTEVERAYQRLNGLVESDPTYRLLRDTQFLTVLTLDELQRRIHDAVANCHATLGQFCNPYTDPQVLSLLPGFNADHFNLLGGCWPVLRALQPVLVRLLSQRGFSGCADGVSCQSAGVLGRRAAQLNSSTGALGPKR